MAAAAFGLGTRREKRLSNIRHLTIYAVLTALTVAISLLVIFPVPATNGFVTLCEAGIYTTALLFGPIGGLAVGGLSGLLIDLLSGYPQWAIFSLVIHGIQGWIVGYLIQKNWNKFAALIIGSLIMIIGYALAGWLLYDWPAGIASVPGNTIQNLFGIIVTLPLVSGLKRALPKLQK